MYFANFCSGLLRSKIAASLILAVVASMQVLPANAQSSVENSTRFSPPPTVADPKPGNNTSRVIVPVLPPSIVIYAKTSDKSGTVKVGDTITNFDYDHKGWFLNLVGSY